LESIGQIERDGIQAEQQMAKKKLEAQTVLESFEHTKTS
jgi:hypothetical protein